MTVKIGVIISSTRPQRVGHHVANWFVEKASQKTDAALEILDLREINLPFLSEEKSPSHGEYHMESTQRWSEKVREFDGFVLVTAEYNNGIPAPLKNAIDTLFHEWDRKPVAFVGYGTYGAVRAIEHLVNVTAKVGMVPLSKTVVSVVHPWDGIREDGSIDETFVNGNLDKLLENLTWWAAKLKSV